MVIYSTQHQRREDDRKEGLAFLWTLLLFLVCMAVWSEARAEGLRFELGAGQCQQNRGGKGSWWNDHYRTFIDLNDRCYQVGFSATPWKWRGNDLGVRFAYVDFGRVRINSEMAARDEDQFSNPDGSHCNWSNGSGCLINVKGDGHPRGFSAGGIIERKVGDFMLGAEAGMFAYYNRFTVKVSAYPDPSATPDWSWYHDWDLARGWNATPYLGANVRYGWLTASVRTYAKIVAHNREQGGSSGVTNGEAWQVMVGLSLPVMR